MNNLIQQHLSEFNAYYSLLIEWNKKFNLTAVEGKDEVFTRHFADSIAAADLIPKNASLCDIGSGAGFPGLPLAALFPEKKFLLIDSQHKKAEFIKNAVSVLGIKNLDVLHSRAEIAGQNPKLRESFDLAVCRAVGKLPVILEYCLPLVKVGGAAVFYKTELAEIEIEESKTARKLLGGSRRVHMERYKDILPDRDHILYVVAKEDKTPEVYPRRAGIPSKEPL